ncbi:MAG: cation:proton antiporter [Myxococcales bacterium]|nr:cation:proton antiporter [Myxococcales bacterium]
MHTLLILSAMLFLCVLAGMLLTRLRLPRIAAYVGVGVLFSPDVLGGMLEFSVDAWAPLATELALGLIAFLIGGSLQLSSLRRLGAVVGLAGLGASLGSLGVVAVVIGLFAPPDLPVAAWTFALALGAISVTTDPAATVAVIHQYRARGRVSEALLGIAGVDDAIGVVIFAVIAALLTGGALSEALGHAALEIGGSIAFGAIAGYLFGRFGPRLRFRELVAPLTLAALLLVVSASSMAGGSSILAAMVFGFAARAAGNVAAERLFGALERGEETVFLAFFAIAGTYFRVDVFVEHLRWIAAYVVLRALGKIAGAWLGARLAKAPPIEARWLGVGLIPQAGVALGLALTLANQPALAGVGSMIVNVVLGAAILYELVGPFGARLALARVGELGEDRGRG